AVARSARSPARGATPAGRGLAVVRRAHRPAEPAVVRDHLPSPQHLLCALAHVLSLRRRVRTRAADPLSRRTTACGGRPAARPCLGECRRRVLRGAGSGDAGPGDALLHVPGGGRSGVKSRPSLPMRLYGLAVDRAERWPLGTVRAVAPPSDRLRVGYY